MKTRRDSFKIPLKNSFESLHYWCAVQAAEERRDRIQSADVRKPLASAVKMVRVGKPIVLDVDGYFAEIKSIGEDQS